MDWRRQPPLLAVPAALEAFLAESRWLSQAWIESSRETIQAICVAAWKEIGQEGMGMSSDVVVAVLVLAVWFVVMRFALPRLGIST